LPTKKTFVINTNNKLIQALHRLKETNPETARSLAKSVYDLALLSQREVEPGDLEQIVSRQTEMLEKMATLLV